MKTIKLWLEPDPEVALFQRLRYEWAEVPLREILLKGIHPWQGPHVHASLCEAFMERLNASGMKLRELESHGYCSDLSGGSGYYYRYNSRFERLLSQVREGILFVEDSFSYERLLELAKERLAQEWSHCTVRDLLYGLMLDFNSLRRFIRSKAPQVKLSGYSDMEKYDLASLLTVDDFTGKEDLLIRQALPGANFRCAAFLATVTEERGYLRLAPELSGFQMHLRQAPNGETIDALTYNCQRQGEQVQLIPVLCRGPGQREVARQIASRWSDGERRYCLTLHLDQLCHMVEDMRAQIDFAALSYTGTVQSPVSEATVYSIGVPQYQVGLPVTVEDTVETLRETLRDFGVSGSGNKDQLAAKLAKLCARVYRRHERVLDEYFADNRFIRSNGRGGRDTWAFPLLQDCSLRNMVLTMYLLRHLRGDAIVDAAYVDDTYDLTSLARALIQEKVELEGSFLRVEDESVRGGEVH